MSSHWPISSTCCFRTCNHIKGRSLFTDWIIQQRTLYRHCDQLTCTHLLFDFNFGTDAVQYLSDSYYYYFLNPSEVAWFTVPLGICLSEPDITFDNIKNQMITFLKFNNLRGTTECFQWTFLRYPSHLYTFPKAAPKSLCTRTLWRASLNRLSLVPNTF